MAQITHYEVGQQVNGRGKVVYQVACGKLLLGHAGVRVNIAKVTCNLCINNVMNKPAAKVQAYEAPKVELNVVGNDYHNFNAEQMHKWVHTKGFKKLGQGASRKCYDMGNGKVVKINHNTVRFGDQCAKEVRVWKNSDEKTRQYLAPILEWGEGWVIMEKAQDTAEHLVNIAFGYQIGREIMQATMIRDLHPANIGYFGCGVFKVLDYAL